MNKEWSEKNKRMQQLIKKADTFDQGKDVLFELRNELMDIEACQRILNKIK